MRTVMAVTMQLSPKPTVMIKGVLLKNIATRTHAQAWVPRTGLVITVFLAKSAAITKHLLRMLAYHCGQAAVRHN